MGLKISQVVKKKTQNNINRDNLTNNLNQFKEIIVVKIFQIRNGVLGLNRDVYLSVVKFLDSSSVRKV
jgi:hypothetical protein